MSMLKVHLVGSNQQMRVQMTSLESPERNSVQMGAWKCHTLCFERCTIYITHLSRHTHHLHTACFQEIPAMSFGRACYDWIPPNAPCFCWDPESLWLWQETWNLSGGFCSQLFLANLYEQLCSPVTDPGFPRWGRAPSPDFGAKT